MQNLNKIWSEGFWKEEAIRIELAYWDIIRRRVPDIKGPDEQPPTEHRIENFVRALSKDTGIGNLHVGLTSSDLEDNIRIKRIEESMEIVHKRLTELVEQGCAFAKDQDCALVAYTHLMPASYTTLAHRMANDLTAFSIDKPTIVYKGVGGAIGDGKIQEELGLPLEGINQYIFPGKHVQDICSQTVNHGTEYNVACWIAWNAACLAKLANDMRQMFAFGQATHIQKDIGSSAMPHKRPNPWRYERVSGMAEMFYDMPSRVARITSACLLERTLNNQSVLTQMFQGLFATFAAMIQDMSEAIAVTKIIDQTKQCKDKNLHSEEEMLKLILKGKPRLEAHLKINKHGV